MKKYYRRITYYIYCLFSIIPARNSRHSLWVRIRTLFFLRSIGMNARDVNIQHRVYVRGPLSNFSIGSKSGVGSDSTFHAQGKITIGDNVMIGQGLYIHTAKHGMDRGSLMNTQPSTYSNVTIGNNIWIGSRVTILPGVTICDDVVIGAASVVTKSILTSGVYCGNPARKVKEL